MQESMSIAVVNNLAFEKAGFPFQSEGTFKQYTEEVLILTQVGLVFLQLQ